MPLIDRYARTIDYLRISITDRCNLSCCYCMSTFSECEALEREEILTYEELRRAAGAAVAAGISKIRVTGGEPLVRKEVVDFCRMLSGLPGLRQLALTTNGVRLAEMAADLKAAGVDRVNISLDTLRRDRFRTISGHDRLDEVMAGIGAAEKVGLTPVKINVVVMRGVNDDEINAMAAMTFERPWHVRFIELMPFQNNGLGRHDDLFMPAEEMMRRIDGIDRAQADPAYADAGPARVYRLPGARGKIGFIAPLSRHFCASCNRIRLTADGKLRSCLFSDREIDLKRPLRSGAGPSDLVDVFRQAIETKPRGHGLGCENPYSRQGRAMHAIGG